MKKTRFIPIYNSKGNSNISFARGKSGVYLIKDKETNNIVYIGYSATQLDDTITRHFREWKDKRQVRVMYRDRSRYTVRIVFTTPAKALQLESALIIKYRPKDNPDKLEKYTLNPSLAKAIDSYEATEITAVEDLPF